MRVSLAAEQQFRRMVADGACVLSHDRDCRIKKVGKHEVVEPDQSDRTLQPANSQRPNGAHRDEVPYGDDCCRRLWEIEECDHQRHRTAGAVVGDDGVDLDAAGQPVDADDRPAAAQLRGEVALLARGGSEDAPVDATRGKGSDEVALDCGITIQARRHDHRAALTRDLLDSAMDRPEELVGDVLDEPTAALGVRTAVVTPQSHTMNDAVAILTGALKVDPQDQSLAPVRIA